MNPPETRANRLLGQKSPYLLQHAYNPVDWYPWGEPAFRRAREEDKPIFLSIGYSTCHWCHVMAAESFSNSEIADFLNENFISIKVDREERPDIDRLYMEAVQAMTGSGGWPLSVFLTHDLKPFYGGTYFPPESRRGQSGFLEVLAALRDLWIKDRGTILKSSETLVSVMGKETSPRTAGEIFPDAGLLDRAYEAYSSLFDGTFGGFGNVPKFPQEATGSFLLRYWHRRKDAKALEKVEKSLQEMARGGLRDYLGGGFHRYATDRKWHLPHFEKMLYNQAMLSRLYLETYQATRNPFYAEIARETLDYVLRDLTDTFGGFYAAEDADSWIVSENGKVKSEGAFYVWSSAEIQACLGREGAEVLSFYCGVREEGNIEGMDWRARNILSVCHSLETTAERFGMSREQVERILKNARAVLFERRTQRPRPYRDDKILADWNGLMIASLAFGFRVLGDVRYQRAAIGAADFLRARLKRKDGRLMHRYTDGEAAIPAFLADHAFFAWGLFELYEATFDPAYLEEAVSLCREMIRLFWDEKESGFFLTGEDSETLILRQKDFHEGALPSGNAMAALVLLKISRLGPGKDFEEKAMRILRAFFETSEISLGGSANMLVALDAALGPYCEIVIDEGPDRSNLEKMIEVIYSRFLPEKMVLLHDLEGESRKKMESLAPFLEGRPPIVSKTAVSVCRDRTCQLSAVSDSELKELFEKFFRSEF